MPKNFDKLDNKVKGEITNFADDLVDWLDTDEAMYRLALHLGMIPPDPPDAPHEQYRKYKWVWWSNNVYNEILWNMLKSMVNVGFLEMGPDQSDLHNHFRWVPDSKFKST